MTNQDQISDDPGTILDSFEDLAKAMKTAGGTPVAKPGLPVAKQVTSATCEEVIYRSPFRHTAPRITICDDGSLENGEVVYVRADKIVIGRAKGDIVIAHDAAMSASHAEIARADIGGKHGWRIRDLGSSNGTFVRCRTVTLRPGMVVLIGSKRFRFDAPASPSAQPDKPEEGFGKTMVTGAAPAAAGPTLVEIALSNDAHALRFPLNSTRMTVGRPGFGNDIELDDLCVAKLHAIVTRDTSGAWQMQSQPSINGLWVKVDATKLADDCLFQCGEQRFRFQL